MAALTPVRKYREGSGLVCAVYLQSNVNTSDTLPLSAHFSKINAVYAFGLTTGAACTATIATTTITLTQAATVAEEVLFLVIGAGI